MLNEWDASKIGINLSNRVDTTDIKQSLKVWFKKKIDNWLADGNYWYEK